jgi:hypothetical protein
MKMHFIAGFEFSAQVNFSGSKIHQILVTSEIMIWQQVG